MKRSLLAATIIATPFSTGALAQQPLMAHAPPLTGLYIGGGGGANWLQNESIQGSRTSFDGGLVSNVGVVGLGYIGYAMANGLRIEIEGDYRNNQFRRVSNFPSQSTAGGREIKYGPMVNVLYDMTNLLSRYTGLDTTTMIPYVPFAPYIGVGIGYQWAKLNGVTASSVPSGFPSFAAGGTSGAFAYQFILGSAWSIAPVPGLAITAEYRFLGMGSRDYNFSVQPTATTARVGGNFSLGNNFNHAILLGLRYNFGVTPAQPPPVAPAPAPAPARSYLVFFDWDKSTLTDRARQIIREAADNSTRVQYTRIEVNGYTDTSGTPKYNQGLSVRRAQAVQAELIRNGVPNNAITIQGFGDTRLLVATGPGVREPQNRRVEIIIR